MTTIHGMTALRAKLAGLQVGADEIADQAAEALTGGVAEEARRAVPVDTGRLRDSITSDEHGVYADAEYAEHVEFGTVHVASQPFMRPAADSAPRHIPEAAARAKAAVEAIV